MVHAQDHRSCKDGTKRSAVKPRTVSNCSSSITWQSFRFAWINSTGQWSITNSQLARLLIMTLGTASGVRRSLATKQVVYFGGLSSFHEMMRKFGGVLACLPALCTRQGVSESAQDTRLPRAMWLYAWQSSWLGCVQISWQADHGEHIGTGNLGFD